MGLSNNDAQKKKRNAILEASRKMFYKKGIENTSIDAIAQQAGIAKGTVYLYFSSKHEICLALCLEAFDTFLDMFEKEIASEKSALEKILTLGEQFYELHTQHPQQFKILQDSEMLLPDGKEENTQISDHLLKHKYKVKKLIEKLIKEGQKEQCIRKDLDPGKTAIIIIKVTRLYILTTTIQEEIAMKEEKTTKKEMIKQLFFFIRSALEKRT